MRDRRFADDLVAAEGEGRHKVSGWVTTEQYDYLIHLGNGNVSKGLRAALDLAMKSISSPADSVPSSATTRQEPAHDDPGVSHSHLRRLAAQRARRK